MIESGTEFVSESKVSGNQANIPAHIRRELDIDDGNRLRWRYTNSGDVLVKVIHRQTGTFTEFEGYEGGPGRDVVDEYDAFGLEPDQ